MYIYGTGITKDFLLLFSIVERIDLPTTYLASCKKLAVAEFCMLACLRPMCQLDVHTILTSGVITGGFC
jgi:hypothetical protein